MNAAVVTGWPGIAKVPRTPRRRKTNTQTAVNQFINDLAQGNQSLQRFGNYQREYIGRRNGLSVTMSNVSEATGGRELVTVYTTLLRNGGLFYVISVAPQSDYNSFQGAFRNVLNSIRLND